MEKEKEIFSGKRKRREEDFKEHPRSSEPQRRRRFSPELTSLKIKVINFLSSKSKPNSASDSEILMKKLNHVLREYKDLTAKEISIVLRNARIKLKPIINKLQVKDLVSQINDKINNFDSSDTSIIFNELAQLGCTKADLGVKRKEGLNTANLVKRINYHLQEGNFDSQHIANTFNDLARLGFTKADLEVGERELDTPNLIKQINHHLQKGNFNPQELANTFNGLAKLGFTKDDLEVEGGKLDTTNLVKEINYHLRKGNFKSQHIANTFNGLAKLGFTKADLKVGRERLDTTNLVKEINHHLRKGNFNSQQIANTFNGLAKLGFTKADLKVGRERLDTPNLIKEINYHLRKENFNSQQIANTFNGLAKLGFTKDDLRVGKEEGLDTTNLVKEINSNLRKGNFNSQQIANTFNGLAKLGFTKDDLKVGERELDTPNLIKQINHHLQKGNFNSQQIANTFNGLAKLGFTKDDLKELNIDALTTQINHHLEEENFNSQHIANTFNSLVKLGFPDQVSEIFNTNKEKIKKCLLKDEEINPNTAFALLQLNVYFKKVLKREESLLTEEVKRKLKSAIIAEEPTTSSLQKECERHLSKEFNQSIAKDIEQEGVVYKDEEFKITTDLKFIYKESKESEDQKIWLEVDGPTHFYTDAEGSLQPTESTIFRNELLTALAKEEGAVFVSICYKEIDEYRVSIKPSLSEFLHSVIRTSIKKSKAEPATIIMDTSASTYTDRASAPTAEELDIPSDSRVYFKIDRKGEETLNLSTTEENMDADPPATIALTASTCLQQEEVTKKYPMDVERGVSTPPSDSIDALKENPETHMDVVYPTSSSESPEPRTPSADTAPSSRFISSNLAAGKSIFSKGNPDLGKSRFSSPHPNSSSLADVGTERPIFCY